MGGRVLLQKLSIHGELRVWVIVQSLQSVRKRHLSELVVMPVGFSVRSNVHELGSRIAAKALAESVGKAVTILKEFLERYTFGDSAVIEEHGYI